MAGRASVGEAERRKVDPHLEAELDRALAHTFPASDPVSVGHATGTEPPARPVDRAAPEIERPDAESRVAAARRRKPA